MEVQVLSPAPRVNPCVGFRVRLLDAHSTLYKVAALPRHRVLPFEDSGSAPR